MTSQAEQTSQAFKKIGFKVNYYKSKEDYIKANPKGKIAQAEPIGKENLLFKQQVTSQAIIQKAEPQIKNTFEPTIKEIERFLLFLNKKFSLGLDFKDITILISQAHPHTKGYFSPKEYKKGFENTTQKLRAIVLNTIHLKSHPYETIAHELAHYYNDFNKIKDCSSNQYHNKKFKVVAERLLLEVEKLDNKGFAFTRESKEFLEMLKEFEPDENAFHISQNYDKKPKTQSRLYLWVCDCGFKIRCGNQNLKASCDLCHSQFKSPKVEGLKLIKMEIEKYLNKNTKK